MRARDIHDAVRGQLAGEVLIAARSNGFDTKDVLSLCRTYYAKHYAELSTDEYRELISQLNELKRDEASGMWSNLVAPPRPKDAAKEGREAAARTLIASEMGGVRHVFADRCGCSDCN